LRSPWIRTVFGAQPTCYPHEMSLPSHPRIAVVGVTGAVGRVMLNILAERRFPHSEVVAIASKRSEGMKIDFNGQELTVRALDEGVFDQVDLALFDTPDEVARLWAPKAVDSGAIAVDNSAAWRMEDDVPLVVPEVNPSDVSRHKGIIASPNCTTIGVVVPLWPLHREFGLKRVVVSSYQAVSGAGRPGVDELSDQASKLHSEFDALAKGRVDGLASEHQVFPATIAFNVVPQVGSVRDNGYTGEEMKLLKESRKIMGLAELALSAACVRVPTVVGHGSSVLATFEGAADARRARDALENAPGVKVVELSDALSAAGGDDCLVSRLRVDVNDPHSLWFFTSSDNLRKGAATNAVQVAELLFA